LNSAIDAWHDKALNKHTENIECHCCLNKILRFNGSLTRDFRLQGLLLISFPPAPQYSTSAISIFFENLGQSYSQLCVDNGDKLFTGVNDAEHKKKKLPVSNFFSHLSLVLLTPVINLYFRISQGIS
jgi:hypothetical protein